MKVLKFGGTSVGSIESLLEVKRIVEAIRGKAIIVVSALGGLTDKLISTAKQAASQDDRWEEEFENIAYRHYNIIENLIKPNLKNTVKEAIKYLLDELKRNYEGISLLRALPDQTLDVVVSFGERMSSTIVAALIDEGKLHNSLYFIKTEKWYGKNVAERKLTQKLIIEELSNLGNNEKAIIPGFISTDYLTGEITNLGRGGSDYTAALIAAALDTEILEIWTDVNGFMTADPRIVKDSIVIDHLTFAESMELCSFGAKVIYPPTIYPVFHKNIPIKILNTFNSKAPGSLITDNSLPEDLKVKGVTALKNLSLISIKIIGKENSINLSNRAYNSLSKDGVSIIPVMNYNNSTELNFAISSDETGKAIKLLGQEFAPELSSETISLPNYKDNLASIAIVGKNMKDENRLMARIAQSLLRQKISIEAYSHNSPTTLLFIIEEDKTNLALSLIHSLIYN